MATRTTLEQKRAAYAWSCVQGGTKDKDYTNLAKGAPVLIMNNGLMQTLAFYQSKGKNHHKALNAHICSWLKQQVFPDKTADFQVMMTALHRGDSARYRQATEEALALLRWIRQFAAATNGQSGER